MTNINNKKQTTFINGCVEDAETSSAIILNNITTNKAEILNQVQDDFMGNVRFTPDLQTTTTTACVEDPRYRHSGMTTLFNRGFTLIELLVVVLIIGILAAVALPQYQKAVIKSRVSTVLPLLSSLVQAEEIYYLSNGTFTDDLLVLDITMPASCILSDQQDTADYAFTCGTDWYIDWNTSMKASTASYCPGYNHSFTACKSKRDFQISFGSSQVPAYSTTWAKTNVFRCVVQNSSSLGQSICKALGKPIEENGKIRYELS